MLIAGILAVGWKRHFTSGHPPRNSSPQSNMRKTSDNLNGGTFYQIPDQYSSKVSKCSKTSLSNCHKPQETKEMWWLRVLYTGNGILTQRKDTGKISDVWIKRGVSHVTGTPWYHKVRTLGVSRSGEYGNTVLSLQLCCKSKTILK